MPHWLEWNDNIDHLTENGQFQSQQGMMKEPQSKYGFAWVRYYWEGKRLLIINNQSFLLTIRTFQIYANL